MNFVKIIINDIYNEIIGSTEICATSLMNFAYETNKIL